MKTFHTTLTIAYTYKRLIENNSKHTSMERICNNEFSIYKSTKPIFPLAAAEFLNDFLMNNLY